jgi:hypothetical protein
MTEEPRAIRGWLRNGGRSGDLRNARRCGAKTRKGTPCQGPAMPNGRCRMHGGPSTGPRTPEGKARSAMSNYRHGYYTAEAIKARREARRQARVTRQETTALLRRIRELFGPP